MLEVLKHAFGLCGDGHITLWHIVGSISSLMVFLLGYLELLKHKIKSIFKKKNNGRSN